jgi:hypothetical protein
MNELCQRCDQRGIFGYRNKETGDMTWYCAAHRLGQYWADARRDIQSTNKEQTTNNEPSRTAHEPFLHFCHCGSWGAFGYGVSLRNGKPGKWFCGRHRPDGEGHVHDQQR